MNEHHTRQLAAYRRAHDLTQEDLAELLNVSAATISRWENLAQSPDPDHISMIQALLGFQRLDSLEEWCFRVNRSQGYEVLIEESGTVIAVSQAILALKGPTLEGGVGSQAFELLPLPASAEAAAEYRRCGYFSDRERFFRREIRLIKFKAELITSSFSGAISGDYWPILASNQKTYALFTFLRTGSVQDKNWQGAYRLTYYKSFPLT